MNREDIVNKALIYLLKNVGDAALVEVKQEDDGWLVLVYGRDSDMVMGQLVYTNTGEMIIERSTSPEVIRQTAIQNASIT